MHHLHDKFDPNNASTWSPGLIAFASVVAFVGLILFIVTVIWFFTWIKYSWFHRSNTANLTGGQLAQSYLQKHGVNAKRIKFRGTGDGYINRINVESAFFYLRPYVIKNGSLTLRLLPWTYSRQSIYTLAMAMESAWAISSSKSNRFNSFWWDFSRKITLIFVLLPLVFAALFALAPYTGFTIFPSANSSTIAIVLSIVGSLVLILFALSQLSFYSKSRKEITANLVGVLSPYEIKAINWIFKIKFIYYLVRMIYEVLRLILQIIILVESNQKN